MAERAVTRRPDPDPDGIAVRMASTDIASELFLPAALSSWRGGLQIVKKESRGEIRSQIAGVRLHAADPTREDLTREREVQKDITRLVDSVRRLRERADLHNAVLARKPLVCRQTGSDGRRVRFGLRADPGGAFAAERDAARECHARIEAAVRQAWLRIEHPPAFDPSTGLEGLSGWARELRLRRRRRPWWLLLLLLPLLLLVPIPSCEGGETFFGMPIETESLIVLVDKSSSMARHFEAVRHEAARVLHNLVAAGGERWADVIAYDAHADSALGGLQRVDDATAVRLQHYLEGMAAGGGTALREGLLLAAREVARHDRPTTLVILTDAEDSTIPAMLGQADALLQPFAGVKVVGNAVTPRLFGGTGDPLPETGSETALSELAERLGGRFGPQVSRDGASGGN